MWIIHHKVLRTIYVKSLQVKILCVAMHWREQSRDEWWDNGDHGDGDCGDDDGECGDYNSDGDNDDANSSEFLLFNKWY